MFLLCAFFLGNYMKLLTKKSFISIAFLLVFIALGQFAFSQVFPSDYVSRIWTTKDGLAAENINVQMISQGASKVNFSMICDEVDVNRVVQVLHTALFGEKAGDELK